MNPSPIKHVVAAALASLAVAGAGPAAAADWFLKLDKIQGESTDDRHKGEIEVLSWSWGVSQVSPTTGARTTKPCVKDLAFTKLVDKSTPQLIGDAATGMHIANGILIGRKAGGDQQEYLKIELKDILVSSFQTGGSGGGGLPTEAISLNFASMTVEYRMQNPDGSMGQAVTTTISGGC